MRCYKCRKTIDNEKKVCPYCGTEQVFSTELIKRAIEGDEMAQAELYNRTYTDVYYTIFSITREEDLIFDMVQDTYLAAFQKLEQLNEPNSFRAWVKRIAHNKTLNALRDRKIEKTAMVISSETEEVIKFEDDRIENIPEASMDQKETTRLLNEILNSIPEDQRIVIGMFYYEQLSVSEIAKDLECSENTVKSRLNYGRKKIQDKVIELEKKGTKLYNLAPIPFFMWLLSDLYKQPNENLFYNIRQKYVNLEYTAIHQRSGKYSADKVLPAAKASVVTEKGIKYKIIAGIVTTAVLGGAGITYYNYQKGNTIKEDLQNKDIKESDSDKQNKKKINKVEMTAIPETSLSISPTPVPTLIPSPTPEPVDTIENVIASLDYQYVGGTSYDVTYTTGNIYGNNSTDAGISLKEAPIGVVGVTKRDMDGDGTEELLLAVLKPSKQSYLNNGKTDGALYFEVYKKEGENWILQGKTSDEDAYNVHITEFFPNVKVACTGTSIAIVAKGMAVFSSDPVADGALYTYTGDGFTCITNEDLGYTDGAVGNEFTDPVNNASADDFLCQITIPEIYDSGDFSIAYAVYQGTPADVTLAYRDNGNVEAEQEFEGPEISEEPVNEIMDGTESTPSEWSGLSTTVYTSYDDIIKLYCQAITELWDYEKLEQKGITNVEFSVIIHKFSDTMKSTFGYVYKDLDGNGTDELLIVGHPQGDNSPYLYEIYETYDEGIKEIFQAYNYRDNAWLTEDNLVCHMSTGGAAYHEFTVYQLLDGKFRTVEDLVVDGKVNPEDTDKLNQLDNKYSEKEQILSFTPFSEVE